MANTTVYPYGTGGSLPSSVGVINDLVTGGVDKALSAEMGKEIGNIIYGDYQQAALSLTWTQGSLTDTYHSLIANNARIITAIPFSGIISYSVTDGYYIGVHSYSIEYNDVNNIPASDSNGYIGLVSDGWVSGDGTFSQPTNGKTFVIVVKKGSAGTENIAPSAGSSAVSVIVFSGGEGGLNNRISTLEQIVTGGFPTSVFRQGSIGNNHEYISNMTTRIVAAIPFSGDIVVETNNGYYVAVHSYSVVYDDIADDTTGTGYLGSLTNGWTQGPTHLSHPSGGKTYVVIVKKGTAGTETISPSVVSLILSVEPYEKPLEEMANTMWGDLYGVHSSSPITESLVVEQGGIDADGSLINAGGLETKRIRTAPIRVYGQFSLTVTPSGNSVYYNVYYYDTEESSSFNSRASSEWLSAVPFVGTFDGYMRIVARYQADNTDITQSAITASITQTQESQGAIEKIDCITEDTNNYVYGTDLLRRCVSVSQIGTLSYLQAFCVYGGKYYSTNGSKIAEQSNSFTSLRDVSISLGHGNSLQVVSNGKAWASGWDDQKMYRVDLSTLTVDQTVTLPTSGYTTVAVDDANGLMYVFQRSSYPSTIAAYNFIVYDYVNEEIKSTRVIESFAAMQATDYYEGKILMLYGLGTSAAPSGMRIYNTAGDVLVTYDLSIFASTEPEGICFERDNKILLVSDVNKKIYKVSAVI